MIYVQWRPFANGRCSFRSRGAAEDATIKRAAALPSAPRPRFVIKRPLTRAVGGPATFSVSKHSYTLRLTRRAPGRRPTDSPSLMTQPFAGHGRPTNRQTSRRLASDSFCNGDRQPAWGAGGRRRNGWGLLPGEQSTIPRETTPIGH
jgi:hypothetical protein